MGDCNGLVTQLRTTPLYESHGEETALNELAADEIERLRGMLREARIALLGAATATGSQTLFAAADKLSNGRIHDVSDT